jgi:hypothetical protein
LLVLVSGPCLVIYAAGYDAGLAQQRATCDAELTDAVAAERVRCIEEDTVCLERETTLMEEENDALRVFVDAVRRARAARDAGLH